MEEKTTDTATLRREYVTGKELRQWLDRLTQEELDWPVLVMLGKSDTQYVVVDFGCAARSGGGEMKYLFIEEPQEGQDWVPRSVVESD